MERVGPLSRDTVVTVNVHGEVTAGHSFLQKETDTTPERRFLETSDTGGCCRRHTRVQFRQFEGQRCRSRGRSGSVDLTGAGATFPYPLYSKWFADYAAATGVRINYQSIGSGGGIRQLSEGTVDFGASDSPMKDDEIAKAKGPVMHFPTVLGAVAVTYNLAALGGALRLSGQVLGDIFMGRITKWNDTRIAALNPGVSLPGSDILVVHRSDGSGTTFVFTDYLATVSPTWSSGPGRGKEVPWPVGLGGKGNEGVAGQVKQTPGSIGYVELAYAKQNNLPFAAIQNASGSFVVPSPEGMTAAAAGVAGTLPRIPTTVCR